MQRFSVRKANADDAYGISYVNAHTRYSTYRGLIPEKMLETRINTIDERTEKTREFIENGKDYLVVENNEIHKIVGMSVYGPSRNENYHNSGEIYAIYILKEYQKLGLGKELFSAGINELIKLGYNDMIINVLKGNNAIDFYKKYGGQVVGEKSDQFGVTTLEEYILFFDNIKSIK